MNNNQIPTKKARHLTKQVNSKPIDLDMKEGQSIELLKALHILTREGKINQDSRRKLKQVYHLYNFIEKLLLQLEKTKAGAAITMVDHGAGKSYLGFIVYDLFFKKRNASKKLSLDGTSAGTNIYGIETRNELTEYSKNLAKILNFTGMDFLNLSVNEATQSASLPKNIDIVTALHACDTATDDAIAFGLAKNASYMVLVPCCQAEMAATLRKQRGLQIKNQPLAELWRHPLHTRDLGSQLTNVLRCLHLEASGYQVTVTELVGWEHSMKNELILANKSTENRAKKQHAKEQLESLLDAFGLKDTRFHYMV